MTEMKQDPSHAAASDGSNKPVSAISIDEVGQDSLRSHVESMLDAFWHSSVRNTLIFLGSGIFVLIVLIAVGQVAINQWNVPFYDALSKRDLAGFYHQLLIFFGIAGVLLVLNVAQTWFNQMFKLKMREGLARDLVGNWLQPGRAFQLANSGAIGVNPDQRMHEDARHLAETSADLGINLLQSTVILISFVGVLWTTSSGFVFHFGDYSFAIPGYMVWAVILYAASASLLTWLIGKPLVKYNSDRYAQEAEFRTGLMQVNEHLDSVTLARGEADEKRRLGIDIDMVLAAIRSIAYATTRLTWVTAGYGWLTIVAPILVAAPIYFSGGLSFGGLMMAVGAFSQVHNSLRWFVDNFGAIADWRATLMRVASFRKAVKAMDHVASSDRRLLRETNPDDRLSFDKVLIAAPDGCVRLSDDEVAIKQGEHVVISGETEQHRTLLFRAIGGLWPWGEGRIGLPANDHVAFMLRSPYFPQGDLQSIVIYPLDPGQFTASDVEAALKRVGLEKLVPNLARMARWDRILTGDEKQRIAFARVILQRPHWLIVDGVFDEIDSEMTEEFLAIIASELPQSTVVYLGKTRHQDDFFSRDIELMADPEGCPLSLTLVPNG